MLSILIKKTYNLQSAFRTLVDPTGTVSDPLGRPMSRISYIVQKKNKLDETVLTSCLNLIGIFLKYVILICSPDTVKNTTGRKDPNIHIGHNNIMKMTKFFVLKESVWHPDTVCFCHSQVFQIP